MKAVVVELKNELAAVLSEDGCIVTVKNNYYEIGQEIQMRNHKFSYTKKIATFVASAAALVLISVGTWAYASPYSYVSLDVNPSIEFTVNRFDRVLRVKAVNDDGEEILQEISLENLENQTIEDAITSTVAQISEAGYFKGDIEGGIVIATYGKDEEKAEELAQELQLSVENEVAENDDDVIVEAFSVGLERVEEARALGVTPGKLNLVEKLQASATDPSTVDLEEWLAMSVKDIMRATKDNKKVSVVSGSAITINEKDIQKKQDKEQKAKEKEEQKTQKEAEKAKTAALKATEKAEAAADKAKAAEEKSLEKTNEAAKKKADKLKKEIDKASDKVKNDAKLAVEKAEKDALKSKVDALEAKDAEKKAKAEEVKAKAAEAKAEAATKTAKIDKAEADKISQTNNNDTQSTTDSSTTDRSSDTDVKSNSGSDNKSGNANNNNSNSGGKK
jgi:hypothetical protein